MARRPVTDASSSLIIDREVSRADFPPNFVFGVATSAYQVEGGAKEGNKGPSIWDTFTRVEGKIIDGSNGDIAVDQYHRYKEDVELISTLGFSSYRFSVAWSRIFPDGLGTELNLKGIAYYNNLIDALLEKGIEPYITLYHWDLPLHLDEKIGGWLNKDIVKYFTMYADACFKHFGDRVKKWITINEPLQTSVDGYGLGKKAPGRYEKAEIEQYLVSHHLLLAHAYAVSLYRTKYKEQQKGEIGLTIDCEWAEPFSNKDEDKLAAARRLDFHFGWYLNPVYYGDYPDVMRERLGDRLPRFTEEERGVVKGSFDFLGLNHYTSRYVAYAADNPEGLEFTAAQEAEKFAEWEGGKIGVRAASSWLYVVPWGLRRTLNYIKDKYSNFPIYITENGMDDEDDPSAQLHEMLDDKLRVTYFKGYLAAVSQAIKDGVDVRGYFAWSLLDNFEWAEGYTKRFGLVYVDYKNGLTRHPKSSAKWFMKFLKGCEEKNMIDN